MLSAAQDLPTWVAVAAGLVLLLAAVLAVLLLSTQRRLRRLEAEAVGLRSLQARREEDAARLRFFFEHSRDAVFVIDREARVVEANEGFAQLIGRPLQNVTQLHIWDFDLDFPRDRALEAVNQTEPELQNFESRWFGPTGQVVHVGISINRVEFRGRRLILGAARDIGEHKRAEAALARHRDDLEGAVAERTVELAGAVQAHADSELRLQVLNEQLVVARDRAEDASRAKSVFLATISHEIRTPLNAIIGLTHLMQRDQRAPSDSERLGKVAESAHHLLDVINDVLDLSRLESGTLVLAPAAFQLRPLLERCGGLVAERAQAKGLSLAVEHAGVPDVVAGDAARLSQAIVNLLANAVKFTDQGGVRLQAEALVVEPQRIKLVFTVHDSGVGVPPERLPLLFSPFQQVDGSSTRRFGGTGLGLAITRRLAQMMGGEVGVSSTVGVGSCFWFSAWLERSNAAAPAPADSTSQRVLRRDLRGTRLLLAEDNLINQEVAVELLEAAGAVVDVADDGEAAVQRAAGTHYDLVLMDVQMPLLDGLGATRRLRGMPQHAGTPIIAMTANAFGDDRVACIEAGMNDHIGKPVDPDQLFDVVARWLGSMSDEVAAPTGPAPLLPDSGAPGPELAAPPAPAADPLPPIEGLVPTRALTYLPGHEAIYRRVLARFAAGHGGGEPPLPALAREADSQPLRTALHALRGSLGAIGAVALNAAALALEQAVAEDPLTPDERVRRTDEFDAALRALASRIDAALAPAAADTAPANNTDR